MTALSVADFDRARQDPEVFAALLVGQPLWPHQQEVVRSTARYRVLCAGRRAGKTRVFGVLALHAAFSRARSKVLILSNGERAAKRMFADVAAMAAAAPLLQGSVQDETTSTLVLSNGSVVECVPASMAAVRSAEADLLIIDEAGFIDPSIWQAAEPTVVARPGSRVLLCSTPWGDASHFFRALWTRGMETPDEGLRAWHWPSTVSPMVDPVLLEEIRERESAEYFEREYLAQWTDGAGAYFASDDIAAAVDDQPMLEPAAAGGVLAVGGVDWGQARDASTLVVVVLDGERMAARTDGRAVYRVSFALERYRTPYHQFIDELVQAAQGYRFQRLAAETNGVGQMPCEELRRACLGAGLGDPVLPVTTTSATKADGFGLLRMLLQQGRLVLPNHPALLKQLRALQFEQMPGGGVRISVPDAVGHDDLAMALGMAALVLLQAELLPLDERVYGIEDLIEDWDPVVAIGPDI